MKTIFDELNEDIILARQCIIFTQNIYCKNKECKNPICPLHIRFKNKECEK